MELFSLASRKPEVILTTLEDNVFVREMLRKALVGMHFVAVEVLITFCRGLCIIARATLEIVHRLISRLHLKGMPKRNSFQLSRGGTHEFCVPGFGAQQVAPTQVSSQSKRQVF